MQTLTAARCLPLLLLNCGKGTDTADNSRTASPSDQTVVHLVKPCVCVSVPCLLAARQFGQHITVQDVIALQVRVERQEKPKVESVSFDRNTANVFQAYMQGVGARPCERFSFTSCAHAPSVMMYAL